MLTTVLRTQLIGALTGVAPEVPALFLSLHSDIPDDSGSFELAGGSPAYSRLSTTTTAPTSPVLTLTGNYSFNVPAGRAVTAIGYWTALTGGTFLGYTPQYTGPLRAGVVQASDASAGIVTSPGHGLIAGYRVHLYAVPGAAIPGGVSAGIYFVKSVQDSDHFTVTPTLGGQSVLTGTGSVMFQRVTVSTFSTQGTFAITSVPITY